MHRNCLISVTLCQLMNQKRGTSGYCTSSRISMKPTSLTDSHTQEQDCSTQEKQTTKHAHLTAHYIHEHQVKHSFQCSFFSLRVIGVKPVSSWIVTSPVYWFKAQATHAHALHGTLQCPSIRQVKMHLHERVGCCMRLIQLAMVAHKYNKLGLLQSGTLEQ
jgi:hypothetical protein